MTTATAQTSAPPDTCPLCDRTGFPILPLRYAVARTDKGRAPDISAPFDPGQIELPADSAKYTLRLLRPGFLYTFDEVRGEWAGYVVTRTGLLYHFDVQAKSPPQVPEKTFSEACTRKGDPYTARCIMVKDAMHAGNIWLGFSDVMWTPDVLERHAKADYRKKHMRCINVGDVRAKKKIAHADTFKKLTEVAEFSKTIPKPDGTTPTISQSKNVLPEIVITADICLGYSHQPMNFLGDQVPSLQDWGSTAATPYQPMMVAVPDPAGIATELALLMQARSFAFMHDETHDKDRLRKTALSGAIGQIREAIQTQAEQDYISDRESMAQRDEQGYPVSHGMVSTWVPGNAALAAQDRHISKEKLAKVRDDAWKKYSDLYSENDLRDWQNNFNSAQQTFETNVITPLAQAHHDWMNHDPTHQHFICNYDTKAAESGVVYTTVFGQCIAGTQDKQPCAGLFNDWLQGNMTDQHNLLLRALSFNQDLQAEAVENASKNAVAWAELPWDKLIGIGKTTFEQLLEAQKDEVGRLTTLVAGAITTTLKRVSESGRIYSGLVALGVMAKSPFVEVTISGSKKAFRELLIKNMLRMSGKANSLSENKMKKAVADELRRQQVYGVDVDGADKKTWLLMIDPERVRNMPKGLSADGQVKWLMKSIHTPAQVEDLNLASFREAVSRGSERVKINMPFAFGVLGLLANGWAMHSILKGDEEALAQHKDEMRLRVYTQAVWVTGATADAIEAGLTRLGAVGSRFGVAAFQSSARIFGIVGRLFGVIGGIAMAFWDLMRAGQEFSKGHAGAGAMYVVSAILGGAATLLLAIGWTGWGLVVVGLMVLWAFVMAIFVNNKIQDWIECCYWGRTNNPNDRYHTKDIEMQQLELATAG